MHNVKETSLNIVCITLLALTSVVAVSVFDNDNLDLWREYVSRSNCDSNRYAA